MKIVSATVTNFGSYERLDYKFDGRRLQLIHGATGSGKSTLCDVIPWILFGRTAKDGTVDEVRRWGTTLTTGSVKFDSGLEIHRSRSVKAGDLYLLKNGEQTRGKDLTDTQKIINNTIGSTIELLTAGSYFHEFSPTASFFTTTPKSRRMICEQIVDLTFGNNLLLKTTENWNIAQKDCNDLRVAIQTLESQIKLTDSIVERETKLAASFEQRQEDKLTDLANKIVALSGNLKSLPPDETKSCPTCGTVIKRTTAGQALANEIQRYETQLDYFLKNPSENTHLQTIKGLGEAILRHVENIGAHRDALNELTRAADDLELLKDCLTNLRAATIRNAISAVESSTNEYLSKYFDAEIKVEFSVEAADKLDVTIQKDGNICSFTQLSKGQRQMLKFCFGIAMMKQVANYSSVKFEQLFFDEALDGFDETLKIKAFKLLEQLSTEYNSIFVVEHSSALKEMFHEKTFIQLVEGVSVLRED